MRADGNRLWYDFENAEPFADPATGAAPHCVEYDSVTVYLRPGRHRPPVDRRRPDRGRRSLDAYGDLHVSNCPCTDQAACSAMVDAADSLELLHMLAAARLPAAQHRGDRR